MAQSIQELYLIFPRVSFKLYEPLGVNKELTDLIWDLMQK